MRTQLMERSDISCMSEFDPALISLMHWIYVLKNKSTDELYYGYTNDLKRRLKEHSDKIWKLIYCEGYASELDAREKERKLKHYGQTRTHLKNRIKRAL